MTHANNNNNNNNKYSIINSLIFSCPFRIRIVGGLGVWGGVFMRCRSSGSGSGGPIAVVVIFSLVVIKGGYHFIIIFVQFHWSISLYNTVYSFNVYLFFTTFSLIKKKFVLWRRSSFCHHSYVYWYNWNTIQNYTNK